MFFKSAAVRLTAGVLAAVTLAVPALALGGVTNTGADKLNLRAEASTTSSVLTRIPGGSSVEVLGTENNGWLQVSFSGMTGYVASQYVDLIETISEPVQTEITEIVIPEDEIVVDATPAEVAPVVEETAPVEEVPAAPAEQAETTSGRVITNVLNVRSAPSTESDKCGKLYAGKVVEILEVLDGWYRIEEGYVSSDYVMQLTAEDEAASDIASQAVALGLSLVGSPYRYGGSSPSGFDCSGFTSYIYRQFGITLNRSSSTQLDNGTPVAMSELLPGDLVIFRKYTSQRASHVGLYIGNGQFVHASTYGVGVIVSSLSEAYYTTGFVGGRRVV